MDSQNRILHPRRRPLHKDNKANLKRKMLHKKKRYLHS